MESHGHVVLSLGHGPALWREGRTCALMKESGGYSHKFPPSQNPACTLLVVALPKPRLLGITASPSFAAESNNSIFWLLERFSEFRDFFTRALLFIRKFSQGLFPSLLVGNRI